MALQLAEGPVEGLPLLLLHGVSRRWQDWRSVLPALLGLGHVHALDFRGHGQSDRATDGAYLVRDYAADVVQLLDRELTGPVTLVGHSLGAMVAASVAAQRPGWIRAVVLEDPPFATMGEQIGSTSYPDLFRAYRALAGAAGGDDAIAAALAETRLRPPGGTEVRLGDVRDGAALRFAASCLRRLDPLVMDPIVAGRWLDGYDVAGTLAGIACPALLLQADPTAGGTLPDPYAAELAARLPLGIHLKVNGVGHQIHGTAPERFLRPVTEFLASLD